MMKKLWKYNRPDRACVHLPLILLYVLSFADPFASPSYRNAQKGKFTAVYKTTYIRAWEEELESTPTNHHSSSSMSNTSVLLCLKLF